MSIGEFEEVGDVVKEFTSEEATVVIGTVIDPSLTDEMRVTVVATGLGRPVDPRTMGGAVARSGVTKRDGTLDYQQLERPTVIRKQAVAPKPVAEAVQDVDYLDIPAFLRRQEES